jgi:hypothetical protein
MRNVSRWPLPLLCLCAFVNGCATARQVRTVAREPLYGTSIVCGRDGITDAPLTYPASVLVHVVDPVGGALRGAEISAIDLDSKQRVDGVTGADGRWLLTSERRVRYLLTVQLSGFVAARVDGVLAEPGCISGVTVPMLVGDLAD